MGAVILSSIVVKLIIRFCCKGKTNYITLNSETNIDQNSYFETSQRIDDDEKEAQTDQSNFNFQQDQDQILEE